MCRRRGAAALVAWVAAAAVSASGSTSSADAALERARRATRAMTSTSHLRKKNAARGAGAPERMFLTGNSSLGRRGRRGASKRAHETPRVAVLCVGLVRGLRDPAHRQNMRNLLASVGVSARISVFAFLEAQSLRNETEADDGRCTQSQLTSLLNKMFRGYTIQLKMASLRERAGSFSPIPLAYARHYKTARAVDMMLLDEQERGLTYDWVLSLRIDSVALERKNVTDAPVLATSKWLQTSINATLAAPPGTVLLYQDFVWFADRPTALSMAADARVGTDRAFETRPRGLRGGLRRRHAGRDVDIPRGDRLPSKVRRRSRPAPRNIHVVAAAEFSRADSICRAHAPSNYPRGTRGVAATRVSTEYSRPRPRRRRDS